MSHGNAGITQDSAGCAAVEIFEESRILTMTALGTPKLEP